MLLPSCLHLTLKGLATIDYVDSQDAKVSKTGDTIQGPLNFDYSNSTVEISGDTGSMRRRYLKVRGNNQFEIIAYPGQDNTGSKTAFELKADPSGNPELKLNYLVDPAQNGHAVNPRYANDNYLQLSGGTLSGNVIMEGGTLFMRDADGNEKARIQGVTVLSVLMIKFVLTVVMMPTVLKLVEVVRLTQLLNLLVLQHLKFQLKKMVNEILATEEYVGAYMPLAGGTFTGNVSINLRSSNGQYFTVKGVKDGTSSVSDDFFYAYSNGTSSTSAMNYKGSNFNSEFNLVNKGYVDNAVATAQPAGSYVKTPTADSSASVPIEIYRSGSSYYIKGGSS